MSGNLKCAWCGGLDTQQGFDQAFCLACGKFTSADGERTVATSQANEGVTVADVAAEDSAAPAAPEVLVEPEAPADTPDE